MSWATRYARILAERNQPARDRQRAAYVATQAAPVLTSVVVETLPHGSYTFAQAVADVFDAETVTVSCTEAAYDTRYGPLRIFAPGSWAFATTYDAQGNVLTSFISQAARDAAAKRAEPVADERPRKIS